MPTSHPPIKAHPAKPFQTVADAARDGHLLLVNCNLCRRTVYFLALDLVNLLEPRHPIHIPPFPCSRCGTIEYMRMTTHYPKAGDYGRLPIRRIDKVVQVTKWKNVKLGE